jgi:putative Mn2+ efflux pump MntP
LLLGALAIGVDELAAGVALGAFHQPIGLVVGAIAAQAFIASMVGLRVGWALGTRAGTRAGLAAGLVLIGVAVWLAGLHLARISV